MQTLNQNHSRVVWDYVPIATGTGLIAYAIYTCSYPAETVSQIACGAIASALSSGLIGSTPIATQLGFEDAGIQTGTVSGLIVLSAQLVAGPAVGNAVFLSALAATAAVVTHVFTGPTPQVQRQGT
jgi:hypothetical protein